MIHMSELIHPLHLPQGETRRPKRVSNHSHYKHKVEQRLCLESPGRGEGRRGHQEYLQTNTVGRLKKMPLIGSCVGSSSVVKNSNGDRRDKSV